MDNITEYMMKKLLSVGFRHPDYEHLVNTNMLYSYHGINYCIGGWWDQDYTDMDKKIASEGQWLPDGAQLLDWLAQNDFDVKIEYNSDARYYYVFVTDPLNGVQYTGGGLLLSYALQKVIYKICKSNLRSYIPKKRLTLEVLDENNNDNSEKHP